ncbi:hypothetical protein J4H55_24405 [Vibrio alginolyticus]|uniref:hypothetical protein n=1 Tax=Vibrio alginolyticus TaxID=663 RepID=UPI001BD44F31|nr:hypothetical protein [Vibrio alginolyticus]MBS9995607.1 hypothetical protein [Vibrio alginolyticus]
MRLELTKKWYFKLGLRYLDMLSYRQLAVNYLVDVLDDYIKLGLADSHFEKSILLQSGNSYEQRLSELLVFDYLRNNGFTRLSSSNKGPDFRAEKDGQVYWFEVITPSPSPPKPPMLNMGEHLNNKSRMLNPDPHDQNAESQRMLLKITGAVKEKNDKFNGYLEDGLISETDVCVIVINDTLLAMDEVPMYGITAQLVTGQSGLPLVVEALLGVGNCIWSPKEDGSHEILRTRKESVNTNMGSSVQIDSFISGGYENISAVLGLTLREDYGFCAAINTLKAKRGILVKNSRSRVSFDETKINADVMTTEDADYMSTKGNGRSHEVVETVHGQKLKFFRFMHNYYPMYKESKCSWYDFI